MWYEGGTGRDWEGQRERLGGQLGDWEVNKRDWEGLGVDGGGTGRATERVGSSSRGNWDGQRGTGRVNGALGGAARALGYTGGHCEGQGSGVRGQC